MTLTSRGWISRCRDVNLTFCILATVCEIHTGIMALIRIEKMTIRFVCILLLFFNFLFRIMHWVSLLSIFVINHHKPIHLYQGGTAVQMVWLIVQRRQDSFPSHAVTGRGDHSNIGTWTCNGLTQMPIEMKQLCMGVVAMPYLWDMVAF